MSASNQYEAVSVVSPEEKQTRDEELAALLRLAQNSVARRLVLAVPFAKRSQSDSNFLQDCARDRRAVTGESIARLMRIQASADTPHLFSDELRALECSLAPAPAPRSLADALMEAEEADVALDRARDLYLMEQTPTRASVVWECAAQVCRKVREAWDIAATHLTPNHRRGVA